jgi:drug/metabolite transporter (DMT)-like permease
MDALRWRGTAYGLGAAVMFGASSPLAKLLLRDVAPLPLAALLYLGAGLALVPPLLLRRTVPGERRGGVEAPLRRADLLPLLGIVVAGGIVGPVAMLVGLARQPGTVGALLLNLEAAFTILVALVFFGEHLGRREALAAAVIVAAAGVLGWDGAVASGDIVGAVAIAGACCAWALDNNLSQRLSLRDPVALVRTKALGAGACTLALSWAFGEPLPAVGPAAFALLLGAGSYGLSLLLDVRALRLLGAAREAAVFGTAPFVGAVLAVPLLDERPTARTLGAGLAMAAGVALLVVARHRHLHRHAELEHDHLHVHDEHHRHEHAGGPVQEPHAHPHRHAALVHDHPHVSDLHHRHAHEPAPPGSRG